LIFFYGNDIIKLLIRRIGYWPKDRIGVKQMTANRGDNAVVSKKRKKELTDADLQKRSVKLVVMHLKKKVDPKVPGIQNVIEWIDKMDEVLAKDEFDRAEYLEMRRQLYNAIEWVIDVDVRASLRRSWYSFGKAMDKKVPKK
jgi:hypothetical protein